MTPAVYEPENTKQRVDYVLAGQESEQPKKRKGCTQDHYMSSKNESEAKSNPKRKIRRKARLRFVEGRHSCQKEARQLV